MSTMQPIDFLERRRQRMAPLILTVDLDHDNFTRLDALRREHFPAERNFLDAHLTMFHALPAENEASLKKSLAHIAGNLRSFDLNASGYRSLGRGVALDLCSPELLALQRKIATPLWDQLTAQDRQGFRPHVTIQNKVEPAQAKALLSQLKDSFVPYHVQATGLSLWRYAGGPWEPVARFEFIPRMATASAATAP